MFNRGGSLVSAGRRNGEKKMTIETLIEKLKAEQKNGVYYVLFKKYEELKNLCEKYKTEEDIFRQIRLSEQVDNVYHEINGFIWGLSAVNYISEEENDKLNKELLSSIKGEKSNHASLDKQIAKAENKSAKNEKAEMSREKESPERE